VVGSLFDKKELSSIPNGSILIDYRAGSLTVEDLLLLQKRDVKILRLDTGDALSKEIDMLLYINQNYENNIGEGFYNGVFVSSGNVVCKRGTVIVDNYKSPKRVIGIADGRGQLLSSEDFSATEKLHLREILNYITNS
jgi:hypothetical protein